MDEPRIVIFQTKYSVINFNAKINIPDLPQPIKKSEFIVKK